MTEKLVLYAEDEITNRMLMEVKLKKAGIQCNVVESGEEALDLCRAKPFNIVILDYYMSGMNGLETANKIRKHLPDAIFIALTSDDSLKKELRAKGFSEVVVKPAHGNQMLEIIQKYL